MAQIQSWSAEALGSSSSTNGTIALGWTHTSRYAYCKEGERDCCAGGEMDLNASGLKKVRQAKFPLPAAAESVTAPGMDRGNGATPADCGE